MIFEFYQDLCYMKENDINNIGEFALECSNDDGFFWYYIVRTIFGTTTIAQCGPMIPDVTLLPSGFSQSLSKMPFKEDKLYKQISLFLNDKGRKITKAVEIPLEDAISQFRDLKDYLENYGEEMF